MDFSLVRALKSTIVRALKSTIGNDQILSRVLRGGALAFAIRLFGGGLSYVNQIVIARFLGALDYGFYSFAWNWAFLLSIPAALGLDRAIIRFYPAYLAERDWFRVAGLFRYAVVITLFTSFALLAVASTVTALLAVGDSKYPIEPILVALLAIPILALLSLGRHSGRALHAPIIAFAPHEIAFPILVLCGLGTVTVINLERSAVTVLSIVLISLTVVVVVQGARLIRCLPPCVRGAKPQYEGRLWVRVALPMLMVTSFGQIMERADVIMVGMFLSPKEVAVYYAASRTAALVQTITVALIAFAAPTFSALHAARKHEELERLVLRVSRWIFWPTLGLAVALIALSQTIMGFFGPGFTEGVSAFVLLIFGQLSLAVRGPAANLLMMTGHQDVTTLIYGAVLVLSIVLNSILIPALGIIGAAAGTTIALFLSALMINVAVRKRLNIRTFPPW